MNGPVRTTVVFALAGVLVLVPGAMLLGSSPQWPIVFKLALWVDLFLYAIALARWGGKNLPAILFPLALLLGAAFWPHSDWGFFYLAVGVLCWIRSGICFPSASLRTVAAEGIALLGGCALLMLFGGRTPVSWAVGTALFTLVQALYFFVAPLRRTAVAGTTDHDRFDRAFQEARNLLEGI
jgi:hypothetical protein